MSSEPEFVLVPVAFVEFVKTAPVQSGVCCCGDSMDNHPSPMSCGHSPVDQWDYSLSGWLEQIAARPTAPAGDPVAKQWRALENDEPRTAWKAHGQGDWAGWKALSNRSNGKIRIEERDLFAAPPDAAAIREQARREALDD